MKKGYALVTVLAVCMFMTASALFLHSLVTQDLGITVNHRLHTRAGHNAQSGMSEFISRGFHYDDIMLMASGRETFLVLEDSLSLKDHYQVTVTLKPGQRFEATSHGYVTRLDKVVSSIKLRANFQSVWISSGL